jgi:hypothetical protein
MDMHFYWVKDRVKQDQFHIYWGPGYQNLADYFTKHHSPMHHKQNHNVYTRECTIDEPIRNLIFRIARVC